MEGRNTVLFSVWIFEHVHSLFIELQVERVKLLLVLAKIAMFGPFSLLLPNEWEYLVLVLHLHYSVTVSASSRPCPKIM